MVTADFCSGFGKSGIRPFSEIRASPILAKFRAGFAGFGRRQCSCGIYSLFREKTNPTDLSSGVFALSVRVTPTKKVQNSLPFRTFRQKLANGDATMETLNFTASL